MHSMSSNLTQYKAAQDFEHRLWAFSHFKGMADEQAWQALALSCELQTPDSLEGANICKLAAQDISFSAC